jgi:two-component system chemotaxis response regulator CheB
MIVSSLAEDGAEETIAALAMGAADTLPKPGTGRFNGRFSEILIGKLRALGHVEHTGHRIPEPLRQKFESPLRAMSPEPVELLAIGASTGGIHALGCLFQALPLKICVPILVTQHLPAPFMAVFARQLGSAAKREALVAEEGMALLPDRIVIAPGDAHLKVDLVHGQLVARLDRKRSASGCLPSVDPMFASAAAALGSGVMGIVLTGMGRDGVEGATRLVACGGSVMAQDEASCAVYGMPRAVAEAGLLCAILPPEQLARRIASRSGERSWK